MKIFDCFTFYNEFDLAEIRIQELWDAVDYFVIGEANTTHQNGSKPFYFKDQWSRFSQYKEKIRHIMIEDMPQHSNSWINENYQRRELRRGITDLQADDIVIVSDCDEIARSEAIHAIKEDTTVNNYSRYQLGIPLHCFKFNCMMVKPYSMHGSIMVTRGHCFIDPHSERTFTFPFNQNKPTDIVRINHAGWHFSYLGNTEFAINKIKSFAHTETNTPDMISSVNVDEMIKNKVFLHGESANERFEYIKFDDYYPKYIRDNVEKFQHLIIPNATISAYDIYSAE